MESSLSITRTDIRRYIARMLYWDINNLSSDQEIDIGDHVSTGLRSFYSPNLLPGDGSPHVWSFLRPVFHLATVPNEGEYDLPDDFGSFVTDLFFADFNLNLPLRNASKPMVDRMRQQSFTSVALTGQPYLFAIYPVDRAGYDGQRFAISFYPIPDQSYEITGQYLINPDNLSSTSPYPMGGQPHAETLIEACLAAAERNQDDNIGTHNAMFMQRLQASVAFDRKNAGGKVGGFMQSGMAKPLPFNRAQFVTYRGMPDTSF